MMRLLLDTHIFLWYISADSRLPSAFLTAIESKGNTVYLSIVSVWEAVIKYDLGKLPFTVPPAILIPQQRQLHRFSSLLINEGTVAHLAGLPRHHGDPFDRIMIAQALQHDLTLATVDTSMLMYPVKVLSQQA